MLHHTNVDRLWAYWQSIHPDHASFSKAYRGGARFSTPSGTVIGPDSPLQPFFKSQYDFHSSRSVGNISTLGYTYQGLEYWEKSEAQMSADSKKLINQLYGPSDQDRSNRMLSRRRNSDGDGDGDDENENPTVRYYTHVRVEASEVERPCAVEIYIAGEHSGSLFIMEHPRHGVIHGGFPLENALQTVGMGELSTAKTLESILSSLEVAIVKVRQYIISCTSMAPVIGPGKHESQRQQGH